MNSVVVERPPKVLLELRMRRVFVPRIWLGMCLMRVALWLIGGVVESASE